MIVIVGNLSFLESTFDADQAMRVEMIIFEKLSKIYGMSEADFDEADEIEVRELVSEHVARTGSAVGRRVLDEWESLRGSFVKCFPADYKRVLAELADDPWIVGCVRCRAHAVRRCAEAGRSEGSASKRPQPGTGVAIPAVRRAFHSIAAALDSTGLPRSASASPITSSVGSPTPLTNTASASARSTLRIRPYTRRGGSVKMFVTSGRHAA